MRKSPENITACLIDETLVSVKNVTEQTRKYLATIFEYLIFSRKFRLHSCANDVSTCFLPQSGGGAPRGEGE